MDILKKVFSSFIPTLLKYLFVLAIAVYGYVRVHNAVILSITIIEVALVFLLCNELAWRSTLAASIVSTVFLLLISVQLLVLIFSNTFNSLWS